MGGLFFFFLSIIAILSKLLTRIIKVFLMRACVYIHIIYIITAVNTVKIRIKTDNIVKIVYNIMYIYIYTCTKSSCIIINNNSCG